MELKVRELEARLVVLEKALVELKRALEALSKVALLPDGPPDPGVK